MIVVDCVTPAFGENRLVFCVGQTDSKYPQNSDSRALAAAKRCIWPLGCDGGLQSGSSPLSNGVARAKTSDHKKKAPNIAKPRPLPLEAMEASAEGRS